MLMAPLSAAAVTTEVGGAGGLVVCAGCGERWYSHHPRAAAIRRTITSPNDQRGRDLCVCDDCDSGSQLPNRFVRSSMSHRAVKQSANAKQDFRSAERKELAQPSSLT